jgi:kumamolisin
MSYASIANSWSNLEKKFSYHGPFAASNPLKITIIPKDTESRQRVIAWVIATHSLVEISSSEPGNVILFGTARQIGSLLRTTFGDYGNEIYGADWPAIVPKKIAQCIVQIIGLDNSEQFKSAGLKINAEPNGAGFAGYTGLDVAKLYSFPSGNGLGQKIGIVQLGGAFSQAELNTYFSVKYLGTAPTVNVVMVDGAVQKNTTDSVEVALDVQIIAAVCPAASITIYFGPNTMQGFYNTIQAAGQNNDVVSISWGTDESSVSNGNLISFSNLITSLQKPVFVSSGDDGSAGDVGIGLNVGFPASVPTVYACGGTTLTLNSTRNLIASETGWSGSGGGFSKTFPMPDWQKKIVPGTMRGVPDFSANADPYSGYSIYTAATGYIIVGGTSAVSPLLAALFCLVNQNVSASVKKIGAINSNMYDYLKMSVYRDVTKGSNGAYTASTGWDAVTGLGVITGTSLLAVISPPPTPTLPPTPTPPPTPTLPPTPTPPPKPTPPPTPTLPPTPTPPPTPTLPVFYNVNPQVIYLSNIKNTKLYISGKNLQSVTAVRFQGKPMVIVKKSNTALTISLLTGLVVGVATIDLQFSKGNLTISKKLTVYLKKKF